jgi:hypothetical protein
MELAIIIRLAAELGATVALIRAGKLKPYLKKAEAFKLYGRSKVEHWIDAGQVTPRKDGDHSACWRIDRMEIEVLAKADWLLQDL